MVQGSSQSSPGAGFRKPRGVLIAGNWKMNLGSQGTEKFLNDLSAILPRLVLPTQLSREGKLKAVVFPSAISLGRAQSSVTQFRIPIEVGAQNAHWEKKGPFTGEISGPMLQELGLNWVLVGHSERRQFFGETDDSVRMRASSLLNQGFRVIVCIGETRSEREGNQTLRVLSRQLGALFQPLPERAPNESAEGIGGFLDGRLVIAYEPVWAIGTGATATPEQAEESHQIVRKILWDRFGMDSAGRTPILYGGSVTPENVGALLDCPNVDGVLAGGSSVKVESFAALLAAGASALSSRTTLV